VLPVLEAAMLEFVELVVVVGAADDEDDPAAAL
jgi:hypothetical protein